MRLIELKSNESAQIIEVVEQSPQVIQRLGDLGLRPGQIVTCLKKSPFGGVTSYELSHGIFALEDFVTQNILVEKVETP